MKNQNWTLGKLMCSVLLVIIGTSAWSQENVQSTLDFFAPASRISSPKPDSIFMETNKIAIIGSDTVKVVKAKRLSPIVKSVSIYGAGSLFGAITGESEGSDAGGGLAGSVGVNLATSNILCNVFFSYNGKKKVEMNELADLGNSLLNPNIDGQSISASVLWKPKKELQSGVSVKALVADNLWQLDSNTILDASPFSLKMGLFAVPFRFPKMDNKVNLLVDCYLTYRSVMGDFNNQDREVESTMIVPRGYWGFEIGASMQLNSLSFFVQYSNNAKINDIELPGFTGQQITLGLNVTGNLITWL